MSEIYLTLVMETMKKADNCRIRWGEAIQLPSDACIFDGSVTGQDLPSSSLVLVQHRISPVMGFTKRPFAYRNNWPGSLWRSERSANNPDTKAIDRVSAIVTDNNHTGKTV